MKTMKITTFALAALVAGCASTTAEWGGETVVKGADGAPLVDKDGKVQTVASPVQLSAWRHWFDTEIQTADLEVKGSDIKFTLNGYNGHVDTNLVTLVDTSLKGVALLAEKIGAAIATSGGSVAGDAASSAISSMIAKYLANGGSAENATVTCKDGSCTITDGTVTESCTNCYETK